METTTAGAASMQTKSNLPKVSLKSLGSWEKHTKGFGSKLLAKFGFTGRLGAKETGVSQSIEVVVRPNGVGLGFGDVQEASSLKVNKQIEAEWRGIALEKEEEEEESEEEDGDGVRYGRKTKKRKGITKTAASEIELLAESKSWKRTSPSTSKKHLQDKSNILLTASEILKSQEVTDTVNGTQKKQVILDMRYETVRLLTDLSNVNNNEHSEVTVGSSSMRVTKKRLGEEFLYNINLVADMVEIELTNNIRKLGHDNVDSRSSAKNEMGSNWSNNSIRQQLANISRDITLYEKQLEDNQLIARLERLKLFAVALNQVEKQLQYGSDVDAINNSSKSKYRTATTVTTLKDVFQILQQLHLKYPQEFVLFGVINLLPTLLSALLKQLAHHWSPLDSSSDDSSSASSISLGLLDNIVSEMQECINHFIIANDFTTADQTRIYCQSLCEIHFLPILRRLITNDWIHPLSVATAVGPQQYNDKFISDTIIHFFTLLQQSFTVSMSAIGKNSTATATTQLDQLVEMILLPKLMTAVNDWHPIMSDRNSSSSRVSNVATHSRSNRKRRILSSEHDIYSENDYDYHNIHSTNAMTTTTNTSFADDDNNNDDDGKTADSPYIHLALHPWLPLLGSKLSVLYPHIRRKMNSFITHCFHTEIATNVTIQSITYQNTIVYNMLKPWQAVFDTTSFHNLLSKALLPKLIMILRQHVTINPNNQDITFLNALYLWRHTISPLDYAALWIGEFFSKWLQVLSYWLCSADVDLEEVSVWYTGWKQLFTDHELLSSSSSGGWGGAERVSSTFSGDQMQQQWFYSEMNKPFTAALQMMTLKLEDDDNMYEIDETIATTAGITTSATNINKLLLTQAGYTADLSKLSYKSVLESYQQELRIQERLRQFTDSSNNKQSSSTASAAGYSSSQSRRNVTGGLMNVTFKEVVESFAASHNILFHPLSERDSMRYISSSISGEKAGVSSVEGKQMYVFGSIPCYIDQNVLFITSSDVKISTTNSNSREWVPVDLEELLQKFLMTSSKIKSQ